MQRTVRWIPTTEEDREVAEHPARRAEAMLANVHGSVLRLAPEDLPFEVAGTPERLHLRMFLWDRLDARTREGLQAELPRVLPEAYAGDPAAFLDTHALFGWIGGAEHPDASDPTALLAFFKKEDSSVYLGRRDTGQLLFLGYLDELLGLLSGRLFGQVMALRAGG